MGNIPPIYWLGICQKQNAKFNMMLIMACNTENSYSNKYANLISINFWGKITEKEKI